MFSYTFFILLGQTSHKVLCRPQVIHHSLRIDHILPKCFRADPLQVAQKVSHLAPPDEGCLLSLQVQQCLTGAGLSLPFLPSLALVCLSFTKNFMLYCISFLDQVLQCTQQAPLCKNYNTYCLPAFRCGGQPLAGVPLQRHSRHSRARTSFLQSCLPSAHRGPAMGGTARATICRAWAACQCPMRGRPMPQQGQVSWGRWERVGIMLGNGAML